MSGGSFNYLCYADCEKIISMRQELKAMEERLLELGATIYQVNTDGVLYSIKKAKYNELQQVIKDFEKISKLTFETEEFECFYQLAVNDYFGKQKDGIKEKGTFLTKTILDYSRFDLTD